jgi:CHAD domain-containing protein
MAYRLGKRQSVEVSVRNVAAQQVDKAIREVAENELDRHETVHQVRKRCKKLRGLIRLVRGAFPTYSKTNRYFRDAARQLSYVRDAQSVVECYNALARRFRDDFNGPAFGLIRDRLAERRRRVADDRVGLERRLEEFQCQMRDIRQQLETWQLQDRGFAAVQHGLRKTYSRGRTAMKKAYTEPTAENFHEWRKRVKYHWYHLRLLRRTWRELMKVHCDATDKLSDLLGDDHDLAVLRATLLAESGCCGTDASIKSCVVLIDMRRHELMAAARPLGERVFAEKPKQLTKRIHRYWDTWRN